MDQTTAVIEAPAHMPAVSADGKRNAYYLDCKPLEQKRAYAACLHVVSLQRAGELPSLYSACETAIRQGQCRAIGMREQEELQGKAIYFVERANMGITSGAAESMRKFFGSLKRMVGIEPAAAPAKKPKSLVDRIEAPDFATALTDMVKESVGERGKEAVHPLPATPIAVPKLDILPGETPLQAARRRNAEQSQPKE